MKSQLEHLLAEIYGNDSRYRPDAYEFVLEALNFTQKRSRRTKHVTGDELLDGIRQSMFGGT